MKKKISKILGVVLSLTLVLSLAVVFFPAPVAGSPGTDYWTTFDYPLEGDDGGWVYSDTIAGVGPIAKAIDGTMYTAVGDASLFTSGSAVASWSTTVTPLAGTYTAKLQGDIGSQTGDDYAAVVIPINGAVALADVTGFIYQYYFATEGDYPPHMCFYTHDPNDGQTGEISLAPSSMGTPVTATTWHTMTITTSTDAFSWYGTESESGITKGSGNVEPLSVFIAATGFEDHVIDRIQIEYGWWSPGAPWADEEVYIDNVSLNGAACGVEPGELFKSTDDGRTWEATYYSDATYGVVGGGIMAIAPSSIDADIVYVADANYVYKTEDGGGTFAYVAQDSLEADTTLGEGAIGRESITCLAVGYVNDEPHVYVGSATWGASAYGDVHYIYDVAFGGDWTHLDIGGTTDGVFDVYGIGCSPDFDSDALAVAIATDETATWACSNYGASTTWTNIEIEEADTTDIPANEASDPVFPSDFDYDDAYEVFVGITDGTGGDVYLVTDLRSYDLDITGAVANTESIISLALVGEIGATMLLAGANDAADVWYSDDDGETWYNALGYGKPPSGDGPTYVLMADDFETSDTPTAWAATSSGTNLEGAVSLTVDGGATFNQISLIDTDIDDVVDLAVSPAFATDDTLFMLTLDDALDSLWRYDGSYWERVYASSVFAQTINLVAVSPEFADDETLFVAEGGADGGTDPVIFRSTDNGQNWGPTATGLRNEPDYLYGWVIIDADTIIAGGRDADNEVYKTENYGRRAWDEYAVPTGVDTVISFALSPDFATDDTIILGDDDAQVYLSDDAGETWAIVYDAFGDTGDDAYVGFDPDFATNNTIYAAANERIARYLDVTDEDCLWETFNTDNLTTASGMAVSADGTVYVSDSRAVVLSGTTPISGSIQRSVNPLTDLDYVSYTEFELVGTEIDESATLNSLQLTAGSNVLWAVDISTATIWTYDDTLAVPVVLTGPADGSAPKRTGYVSLSWTGLDSATSYEIAWDYDPDFIFAPTYAESGTTYGTITTSALMGETIYWMVRVGDENDAGAPVLSKWSDVRSFTVALGGGQWNPFMTADMFPGNVAPEPGSTDAPLIPGFQWNAADWATGYEFVLADNPDFASPLIDKTVTTPATVSDVALSYSTTYYWKVRAISATSQSEWGVGVFSTIAKPVAVAPPVEITEVPPPAVTITQPQITPNFIYAIIGIGAALAVLVIVLIIRTRRVP